DSAGGRREHRAQAPLGLPVRTRRQTAARRADGALRGVAGVPGGGREQRCRTGGADDRNEERYRQRRPADQRFAADLQQGASGCDHPGNLGNRRRRCRGVNRFKFSEEPKMSSGRIVQIIGAVIDVEFPRDQVPNVYDALKVVGAETTLEVQQQLGDGVVRSIAMGSTEGLKRGLDVNNSGKAIAVPVGAGTLGRIMNVLGEPIDEAGPVECEELWGIHRAAPSYAEQAGGTDLLETGIKVIDLV